MKTKTIIFFCVLLLVSLATSAQSLSPPKMPIRDFVTQTYIHGLPYDEAKSYGISVVPELVQMLQKKDFERQWSNIVTTLGYIGDPSAVAPLQNFVESSKDTISINRFRAVLRVFQALGHIAQSGDRVSIETLRDYTSLKSWQTKNLKFRYNQYSGEALSEVLARQSIVGLGISGRPEALKKLSELKLNKSTRKDWGDNLDEAIKLSGRIQSVGAKSVFGSSSIKLH